MGSNGLKSEFHERIREKEWFIVKKQQMLDEINQTIYRYLKDYPVLHRDSVLQEMIYYALGFKDDGSLLSGGKRLRPLFCSLICGVVSGNYKLALLYGAALEMLHNYTLVHDDIEDNSDIRHNRPALWKKYGLPLALNAGDLLYEISLSAAAHADKNSQKNGLVRMLKMSEDLFLGQHQDIRFENREQITKSEYLQMVRGKTSALIGTSFALGAMAGGADDKSIAEFEYAGKRIGIAFQIRDDYLGTWGNLDELGKPVSADIMDKKNTLAVVYTAERNPAFLQKWHEYDGSSERVAEFADMMAEAGAPEFLEAQCRRYTDEAVMTLSSHRSSGVYQDMLDELISSLVDRSK